MKPAAWLVLVACSASGPASKEQLGRLLFEDPDLSYPTGQACADCHAARAAFRDPESEHPQSMGVVPGRFGARNAPSLFYAALVPPRRTDATGNHIGGLFWDGRARTLEDQAAVPLLNPQEMNNPDKASVVTRIRRARYAGMFRELYDAQVLDDVDRGFAAVLDALASYERSPALRPFASRYDRYLAGDAALDAAELRGLAIFEDPARGDCARCHPSRPAPDGTPPLFTTFGYANLGIPRYANNMFYVQPPAANPAGQAFVDHGLAATVLDASQDGKFRIPTLRNIARTAPYGHNGYFANLPYMLEFVANREAGSFDVPTCSRTPGIRSRCAWPVPEVASTIDGRTGRSLLRADELDDLDAFLETLTDAPDEFFASTR